MAARRKQFQKLIFDVTTNLFKGAISLYYRIRQGRHYPHHSAKQIVRYQRQKLSMIKNSCGQEHIGKVYGNYLIRKNR